MTLVAQEQFESLNLIPESAPGVPTVNGDKLPCITPNFTPKANQFTDQAQTGRPQATQVVRGKESVGGTSALTASKRSLLPFALALFGGHRVRGANGFFTHEYWLDAQTTYAVELAQGGGVNLFLQFLNQIVGKGDFALASEDIMKASFDIVGVKMVNPVPSASLVSGTLTDRTGADPFQYLRAAVKLNGTTMATANSFDVSVDRKALTANAMDETPYASFGYTQRPTVSGKGMFHFTDDATVLNAALDPNNIQSVLATVPQGGFFGAQFELPNIKLQLPTIGASAGLKNLTVGYDASGPLGGAADVAAQLRSKFFITPSDLGTLTLIVTATGTTAQTFTFVTGDNTPALVAAKINATATYFTASVERMAGETGGTVVLKMIAKGSTNTIQIGAGTANSALGFTDTTLTPGFDGQTIILRVFSDVAA